ncbi:UDP-glucose 4-epimerase [Coleophoma cylindrospora]|uniref:UDP-glucose 4-epimerase n=1 Tax=Coleophoma cylindrospora TaxID=1849047 RepID=A0A3D8QDG9_9HELO|nr:UDP-glucose 4-epimerase [Coleophoma cylindrospora]
MYLPTENFKRYSKDDYHPRRKVNWLRFTRSATPRRFAFVIALTILIYLMQKRGPIPIPRSFKSQVFDQLMLTEEQQSHRAEHAKRPLEDTPQKVPLEPFTGSSAFPEYSRYLRLSMEADYLPDIIHIPFEDSVEDVTLAGWEDEWQSEGVFNGEKWGNLEEPKMDFVYTWVNGSDEAFRNTMLEYELNSTLNDDEGLWIKAHGVNRYRDWDELRYSIRSIEQYAKKFRNKIQILVNAVKMDEISKQKPTWLADDHFTEDTVQILSQEDFFTEEAMGCLPTFNSLTIENQIFNTKSDIDRMFALSDDMLLGKPHSASDIYSPLFGPSIGLKSNSYNTVNPPSDSDAHRFGEKPFLIYTSWLLNRRFGVRKRRGQVHFGHSLSRSLTREAMATFPSPSAKSACKRFRGEEGFQLYSWFATFHYTMERHREALLWSYIMLRSDKDENGNLGWEERQTIMADLEEGMANEGRTTFRERMYYKVEASLTAAGLDPPKVNLETLWTSLDGPFAIRDLECWEFNVDECLAPGFSSPKSDEHHTSYIFSSATIFDRLAVRDPNCGDCLIKLLLNRVRRGLSPLLPDPATQSSHRRMVIKALTKYQYSVIEPDALFVMVTDAEQVENILINRLVHQGKDRAVGQVCLNDDVALAEEDDLIKLKDSISRLFRGLYPEPSPFEKPGDRPTLQDEPVGET